MNSIKGDNDVLQVHFLSDENTINNCSHSPVVSLENLDENELDAIKNNRPYYSVKKFANKDVFEAILPIFVDDQKVGPLITTYSLDNTYYLIKTISLITTGLLLLVFIIYSAMISLIISKNKK